MGLGALLLSRGIRGKGRNGKAKRGGKGGKSDSAAVSVAGRTFSARSLMLVAVAVLHVTYQVHSRTRANSVAAGALVPGLRGALAPEDAELPVGMSAAAANPLVEAAEAAPAARHLMSGATKCESYDAWSEDAGPVLLWAVLLLYGLLGLAIICDDFFVASLEKISEVLDLSEDVAGATFMAAGSSAPELFTSTVDVFLFTNNVGIGTIVGSAVFNILIIIALSAAASQTALHIDWRPLTRDSLFYIVSIILFVGVTGDGDLVWWEALILVIWYALYIAFMARNKAFFDWLDVKLGLEKTDELGHHRASTVPEQEAVAEALAVLEKITTPERPRERRNSIEKQSSIRGHLALNHTPNASDADADEHAARHAATERVVEEEEAGDSGSVGSNPQTSLKDAADPGAVQLDGVSDDDTAATGNGDAADASKEGEGEGVDGEGEAGDGGASASAEGAAEAGTGAAGAEGGDDAAPASDAPAVGATGDTAEAKEDGAEAKGGAEDVEAGASGAVAGSDDGDGGGDGDDASDASDEPQTPFGKFIAVCSVPWNFMFRYTIPDCNEEKWENHYVLAFFMSVLWIMVLSYVLVDMAVRIGCALNISAIVMGLTVLAAGTSVPDALGSMVVAQEGMGNMAVSNAIGSNVFDICLGIGLPYLVAGGIVWPGKSFAVAQEDVLEPIIILLSTVLIVYGSLIATKFMLTARIGYLLLLCYVVFVVYNLVKAGTE